MFVILFVYISSSHLCASPSGQHYLTQNKVDFFSIMINFQQNKVNHVGITKDIEDQGYNINKSMSTQQLTQLSLIMMGGRKE